MTLSTLRCATVVLATWTLAPMGVALAAGAAVDAPVADAAQRNNSDAVIALLDTIPFYYLVRRLSRYLEIDPNAEQRHLADPGPGDYR